MLEKKKDLKYGFPEVSDTLKMPRDAKFTTTDKLPTMPLSGRNRRIVSILKLECQASSIELSKRLNVNESTVLKELRYLENLGLVREVGARYFMTAWTCLFVQIDDS
jgi:predicted transcriptional regulator